MRRLLATLLVSVFSFSLIAPALIADANSDLPACCRRGGQHHCAMVDMDADAASQPSGPGLTAHAEKCPYFPKGGAVLPHADAAPTLDCRMAVSVGLSQLTVQAPADTAYRISASRSHQKRGPPSLLS
ncbi:MAG: hypothetical protein ABSH50_24685 [Bryobacteraceae bacterium]|jgi:hypothetical protein